MAEDEYKVNLEVFEGPLDLLLYLIKKDEVDIYNIPIERITTQYMEYLNVMRLLDLNIAGEFIVMAATLMMVKSRMLLPVEERPELDEADEEEDPRWDLVRQLVEYKKFKDAAGFLQDLEIHRENVFGQGSESLALGRDESLLSMQDISLFDLIAAFQEVLKRAPSGDFNVIYGETVTVADKIDEILHRLAENGTLTFSSLFAPAASRHEIICTFLGLLELIRLRQIHAAQPGLFGEITITRRAPDAAEPQREAVAAEATLDPEEEAREVGVTGGGVADGEDVMDHDGTH